MRMEESIGGECVGIPSARVFSHQRALSLDGQSLQRQMNTIELMELLRNVSDPVVRLDGKGKYMSMNSAAEQIFIRLGHDPIAIIGRVVWDVFPELKGTATQNELRRALEDDVPLSYEFYYAADQRWYEAQGFPSSPGAVVILKDITKRKAGHSETG
jgi:PAS domain S-box-containing protein